MAKKKHPAPLNTAKGRVQLPWVELKGRAQPL